MDDLIQQALKALNVTKPIYRTRVTGDTVIIWLAGTFEKLVWNAKPQPTAKRTSTAKTRKKT
jgi:hypothetical protein